MLWRSVVNAVLQGLVAAGGAAVTAATGDPTPALAGAATAGVLGAGAAGLEDAVDALFDREARENLDQQVQTRVQNRLLGASPKELKKARRLAEKILSAHALTLEEWSHLDHDPERAAQAVLDRAHAAGTCGSGGDVDAAQAVVEASYRAVVPYQELIVAELTRIRAGTDRQVELSEDSLKVQRDSRDLQQDQLGVLQVIADGRPTDPPSPVTSGLRPGLAEAYQRRYVAQDIDHGWDAARTQVVHGDGGVGKSQLAQASFTSSPAPVKIWLDASSLEGLVSGYAQAAADLSRARHLPSGLIHEPNTTVRARQLHQWLSTTTTPWFLVLDDLDIPADLSQRPTDDDLAAWWPDGPAGRTLVTTRLEDARYDRFFTAKVRLEVYEPPVAVAYLEERFTGLPPGHLDQVDDLADELTYHPLALSLAAAVIINDHLAITDYLAQLRRLNLKKSLGGHDGRAITRTWRLAVDRAATISRHATAMAELVAYAHPTRTPRQVFLAEPSRTYLARRANHDAQGPVSTVKARRALSALHRLSLIRDPYDDWSPITVHALAQRVIRETRRPSRTTAPLALADAVVDVWDQAPPLAVEGLISTSNTLLNVAEPVLITQTGAHPVLFRTGDALRYQGRLAEATTYLRDLRTRLALLGPDHPDTLTTQHSIASCRARAGDLTGALTEYEQVHTARVRVLGPDHPDTLTTQHRIASCRGDAGDLTGALTELEQVHTARERILGPDHPDTLTTRHSIAYWRAQAGDLTGALTELEQVHTARVRVLGPDHHDTLITQHRIAYWRAQAGDLTGALTELEQVHTARVRVLGPDHHDTLTTRHSIAHWRAQAGDLTGALTELEQVHTAQVRVLGPDHPHTLTTRHSIAHWRAQAGDLTGALTELEQVHTAQVRVLGQDHPDTLTTGRLLETVRLAAEAARAAQRPQVADLPLMRDDPGEGLGSQEGRDCQGPGSVA